MAETEHPQRSVTTLCSTDIPNSAQESALSNASDLGCRNRLQAEVSAEDAGHREDMLQVQTAFGMQTRSKTKADINQTEIALNTANIPLRADKAAFGNQKKSASKKKTMLAGHADEQDSDRDAVLVGTERGLIVKGPDILGNMWDKAGRAGCVEVMREVLYDMISALWACQKHKAPRPSFTSHSIAKNCF